MTLVLAFIIYSWEFQISCYCRSAGPIWNC